MTYAHWDTQNRRWELRAGTVPAEAADFTELAGNILEEEHGQEVVVLEFVKDGLVDAGSLIPALEAALGANLQNTDPPPAQLHGYVNISEPLDARGQPAGQTLVQVCLYQFDCDHDAACPSSGERKPPPFRQAAVPGGAKRTALLAAIKDHTRA